MTNDDSVRRASVMRQEGRDRYEVLGPRLAQLRKSRGFTQAELARRIGVSQQAVFAYEIAERRISLVILERIAKLYGMSLDEVVGLVREPRVAKRRLSPRAMRHAEQIQNLSKTSQRFVVRIIDMVEYMGSMGERKGRMRKTTSS